MSEFSPGRYKTQVSIWCRTMGLRASTLERLLKATTGNSCSRLRDKCQSVMHRVNTFSFSGPRFRKK